MRALITGAGGQVGRELQHRAPHEIELHAIPHADLDITDESAVRSLVNAVRPHVILNAAAYTAVDRAEREPERAALVNALAPGVLARVAEEIEGLRLIHLSTDYVFGGHSSTPFRTDDLPRPCNVYGRTKAMGERAVLEVLGARAAVLRTAWVYSAKGESFLQRILQSMHRTGTVRVVADQIGTPTSASSVADAVWTLARRSELSGIHHWTDDGVASWYDFAVAIAEEAASAGLLERTIEVLPVTTAEYPTLAARPSFSVLDKSATRAALQIRSQHWRCALREVLARVDQCVWSACA
jgi:dTDP-4-dehydrorhamnose reductase